MSANKSAIKLDFEQRQQAVRIAESRGVDDDTAAESVALRSFVQYVRDFYQKNFDVMPVAFQSVDNEATALLGEE